MSDASERIERAALEDLHAAAGDALRASLGLRTSDVGGALLSVSSALPPSAIVINRALGLGVRAPASEHDVAELVKTYRDSGVERYFVHLHPRAAPRALAGWLVEAGLEQARGWQKFSRGRETPPGFATDLRVEAIGAERGPEFAQIVADAFDLGGAAIPWLALLPARARWHVFMSFDGDAPAGVGALFVADGNGWTDFGATAPPFRRRGSQAALLARRVEHALELGCERIFTCTGEAVDGDPQHSYRNIIKAGFAEDFVRANFAPPRR